MKVVIITGLSGAGKTKAADWFEDQGYYVIDNMPPRLFKNVLELSLSSKQPIDKMALVADVRGGDFFDEMLPQISEFRKMPEIDTSVLYIDASVSTIVKRYNETRRSHPLTTGSVTDEVIEEEKELLSSIRNVADHIIDTTGLKGADMEHELARLYLDDEGASTFNLNIMSFGYKHGLPSDADIIVDMRFIPNPFYVDSLRKLTGNNKKVSNFVLRQDVTKQFISSFHDMITEIIPGYIKEGKYHLNIAFGCTGGHHRSVAVANEMARIFREENMRVQVDHRDLDFVSKKG